MKYIYPAIIRHDLNDGVYYVNFPDLECCFTEGRDLYEAVYMAEDVLNLTMLRYLEDHDGEQPPEPSEISAFKCASNEIVTLIRADTQEYNQELLRMQIRENLAQSNLQDLIIECAADVLTSKK